jgi:hypothetical protein
MHLERYSATGGLAGQLCGEGGHHLTAESSTASGPAREYIDHREADKVGE